jgi:hypothetical protein
MGEVDPRRDRAGGGRVSGATGTGAYFFFRHLNVRTVAEAETKTDFEAVRVRFAGRAPLVEVRNLKAGDLVVNKTAHPQGLRASTVHVMAWSADDGKLIRTDLPLWLMRFSSINILSHLGVVPAKYQLTADDLVTYGPASWWIRPARLEPGPHLARVSGVRLGQTRVRLVKPGSDPSLTSLTPV